MCLKKIGLAALLLSFLQTPAGQAADERVTCSFYSKVGSSVIGFVLPLTVQDMVDMMAGKNPKLMLEMTIVMMGAMGAEEFQQLMMLNADDAEMLGQSAGEVAFQLLMTGQATSIADVETQLMSVCIRVGPDKIIENQRKANAATAANLPQ